MKRMVIDTADRIARLKRRLGIQPKRWDVRIKRGGWLTITPPMLRSLGLIIGDVIKWQLTPRGLEGLRERSKSGYIQKRIQPLRLLGKDESILCTFRPSFRRRLSGQQTEHRQLALPNSKPSHLPKKCDPASVYRGPMTRFRKRPRSVSIKHFVTNFEKLLSEVALGRIVEITSRRGLGGVLVPISLKDRMAARHKPKKQKPVSSNAGKRW